MELELDHELLNEQKMEQSSITRERNDMEIDETLKNSINDVVKNKKEELVTNLNHNSPLLQNINCRICLAVEEESGADPIIQLGCQCKDDISFGHKSCLQKWFVKQLLRSGFLDCELCRSPLGAHLEAIVRRNVREVTSFQMQGVNPRVLLLLRVPPDELDLLQVPHDIPNFYELPPEIRNVLEYSLERLEQEHRHHGNRRSADFRMAQILAAQGEGPLGADQLQTRILRVAQLQDQFIFGRAPYRNTNDDNNEDLSDTDDENKEDRDTNDDNNEDRDIDDDNSEDGDTNDDHSEDRDTNDGNMDLRAFREHRNIIRVTTEGLSAYQQTEELLNELSLHVDLFAEVAQETREGMIFFPRSMFSRQDLVLNTTAPRSLAHQGALAPRQYTYGRF